MGAMFSDSNGQLEYPVLEYRHPASNGSPSCRPRLPPTPPCRAISPTTCAVWEVREGSPGKLAYERRALPAPQHEMEQPLEPSTRYFWSVHARFEIGGEPRLTDWSRALQPYNPFQRTTGPEKSPLPITSAL